MRNIDRRNEIRKPKFEMRRRNVETLGTQRTQRREEPEKRRAVCLRRQTLHRQEKRTGFAGRNSRRANIATDRPLQKERAGQDAGVTRKR